MSLLVHQNCLNHTAREAVAQCPQCRHFFCRECITEHDDRVLCTTCLRKVTQAAARKRKPFRALFRTGAGVGGFLTATLFYYWMGELLLRIPTSFHDGTLWSDMWNFWHQ